MNIWHALPRPFLLLAPLEGVADTVFRQIVASCAKPDMFVTEFTSADGFCSRGKDIVSQNLRFNHEEQPIIVQLWGKNPETMFEAAKAVSHMGFAGIDINMGCPEKNVVHHGCGAAMIETPEIASSVIQAVKKGSGGLPVSVKTRIGLKKIATEEWAGFLLDQGIDALTIHGRTRTEMSKVPAHWDEIVKVVKLRDQMKSRTVIIGNGDVVDRKDAEEKVKQYGVDGVMIGRGIFQNLWAFDKRGHIATKDELIALMERHVRLFQSTWVGTKNYAILKKFYKIYINGFHDASAVRERCMKTNSVEEVLDIIKHI